MEIKYVNLYIPHSWLTDLNYNILITVPIVVAARVSKSVNKNIIAMGVIYFSYSRIQFEISHAAPKGRILGMKNYLNLGIYIFVIYIYE